MIFSSVRTAYILFGASKQIEDVDATVAGICFELNIESEKRSVVSPSIAFTPFDTTKSIAWYGGDAPKLVENKT